MKQEEGEEKVERANCFKFEQIAAVIDWLPDRQWSIMKKKKIREVGIS